MKFFITSILILCYLLSSSEALKDPVCGLPRGICWALIPMYSYDSESKRCVFFNYGGCKGNDNTFETEQECKEKCVE